MPSAASLAVPPEPPSAASPPGDAALVEVADGVHAFIQPDGGWCLNNAGLVVGEDGGAVLVDTAATEARAKRLRDAVSGVAPQGVDVVVNTHFHGDHTFGNGYFVPRATVVAHEGTRRDGAEAGLAMRELWPEVCWGETPLTLPTLTFRDTLTLYAGELRVELLHLGPAHTANDVVAWVPERGVLFTGDIVWSRVTPFVLMGSFEGSFRALDRMRELRPRVVVPGHGRPGGVELLDATEAYLRHVLDLARSGLRDGRTPLETARGSGPGPFGTLVDPERLVGNLHRAQAELRGLPEGERIDVAVPFREMAAYHGGLPACRA